MTNRPYQELLARLRDAFPAPVSDRKHDAYFVFSILRALDQVDDLKSGVPLLGRPRALDYAAAERAKLAEEGRSVEEVARQLVGRLEGMPIWGHPRTQINVVPPPSIPSVIGSLLPAIYNPNLVSDDTSYGLMETEAAVVAMVSRLVGYDPARAAGVFTFGGTGTVLYGAKLGIEKAFPDAMDNGVPDGGVILASAQSHYCRLNVAGWLGLGEKSVVAVPTHLENDIRLDRLEAAAREALDQGRRIVALVATMGTTDAFGVDDLDAIADLRDRLVKEYDLDYTPHIHADAVIGWAWSVFNDYDFEANPLGFRPRTVRALASAAAAHLQAAPGGFDRHRLPQDRLHALHLEPVPGPRPRRHAASRPRPGADAVPVPERRAPSRGVHAGDVTRRFGGARGLRQPAALRTCGPARPARPPRRDGGNAPRAPGGPRLHDGPQRRRRRHGHRLPGSIPTAWTPGRSRIANAPTPARGRSCCGTTTTTAGCSGISTSGRCGAKASTSR